MLSLQVIRESPEYIRRALELRHTEAPLDRVIALDTEHRALLATVEAQRAEKNDLSKEIGQLGREMKQADSKEAKHAEHRRSDLVARSSYIGEQLVEMESRLDELATDLRSALLEIPNLPDESAPEGPDGSGNVVVRQSGEPASLDFTAKPHWEIGESLGIIDFERGAKVAGSRFYILRGDAARLQRALITWMLELHRQQGYL
ncbi:MAG: serine--tRNA ligase, partial [Dehalococcoidia bacterium]